MPKQIRGLSPSFDTKSLGMESWNTLSVMRNPDKTAAQGPVTPYKKNTGIHCIRSGTLLEPHWAWPSPGDSLQFDRRAGPLAEMYLYLVGPLFYFAISNLASFTPVNYANCVLSCPCASVVSTLTSLAFTSSTCLSFESRLAF